MVNTTKTKGRVGSIHTGRVSYPVNERAFSKGDVPPEALAAKKQVLAFKNPSLTVGRPEWNQATSYTTREVEQAYEEERARYKTLHSMLPLTRLGPSETNKTNKFSTTLGATLVTPPNKLKEVKTNSKNATLSASRPVTHGAVWGVETMDGAVRRVPIAPLPAGYKPVPHEQGWNIETSLNRRELKSIDKELLNKSLGSVRRVNEMAVKNRKSLVELEAERTLAMRAKKEAERHPDAAEQARIAEVNKAFREAQMMKKESAAYRRSKSAPGQGARRTSAAMVTAKLPPPRIIWNHNGVWEESRVEDGWAWSCCMASSQDSRGCVRSVKTYDSWNL